MKYSDWSIRDLGDDSCIFSISSIIESDIIEYLYRIQQYIIQFGNYSVISYSIITYWGTTDKDLDIITDFPYSLFIEMNSEWNGITEIRF